MWLSKFNHVESSDDFDACCAKESLTLEIPPFAFMHDQHKANLHPIENRVEPFGAQELHVRGIFGEMQYHLHLEIYREDQGEPGLSIKSPSRQYATSTHR